jgi:SM-20-related protein
MNVIDEKDEAHMMEVPDFSPVLDALVKDGYFVGKQFWAGHHVTDFAAACKRMIKAKRFHPATIGKGSEAKRDTSIRSDEICWLDESSTEPLLAGYLEGLEKLRLQLNQDLMLGLVDVEVMAAHYSPGARYGRHFDRFKSDDARTVTAILYLNEDWQSGDGGELRIYFPDGSTKDVEPTAGTMVVFMTADLEHEVLETKRNRLTLTGWYRRRSERVA